MSDAFQHDLADLRGCGDLAHVCVQLLQRGREGQVSPCSSASQHVNNVLWLAAARAFVMILIPASKFHFSDTAESRGMFQKPPFFSERKLRHSGGTSVPMYRGDQFRRQAVFSMPVRSGASRESVGVEFLLIQVR